MSTLLLSCEKPTQVEHHYYPAPEAEVPLSLSGETVPLLDRTKNLRLHFLQVVFDGETPPPAQVYLSLDAADVMPSGEDLPTYAIQVPLLNSHRIPSISPVQMPREMHVYRYEFILPIRKLEAIATRQMDIRLQNSEPLYIIWRASDLWGRNLGRGYFDMVEVIPQNDTGLTQINQALEETTNPIVRAALEHLHAYIENEGFVMQEFNFDSRRRKFHYIAFDVEVR